MVFAIVQNVLHFPFLQFSLDLFFYSSQRVYLMIPFIFIFKETWLIYQQTWLWINFGCLQTSNPPFIENNFPHLTFKTLSRRFWWQFHKHCLSKKQNQCRVCQFVYLKMDDTYCFEFYFEWVSNNIIVTHCPGSFTAMK